MGVGIGRAYDRAEAALEGWPGSALSVTLVIVALLLLYLAWRGTAIEKAIVAAWVIFP